MVMNAGMGWMGWENSPGIMVDILSRRFTEHIEQGTASQYPSITHGYTCSTPEQLGQLFVQWVNGSMRQYVQG